MTSNTTQPNSWETKEDTVSTKPQTIITPLFTLSNRHCRHCNKVNVLVNYILIWKEKYRKKLR